MRKQKPHLLPFVAAWLTLLHAGAAAAAPPAPVMNAPQVAGNTVTLSWTVPPGSTAIRLQAGTAPGASNVANTVIGAISGYSATAVPPGIYYVRVSAIDSSGQSPVSNEVVVTVGSMSACAGPPGPPTLGPAAVNGNSITLTWNAAVAGCVATGFTVQAGSAPGQANLAAVDVGSALSLNASAPAGTYYVRVVAAGAAGVSAPSNEVTVVVASAGTGPPPPASGPIVLTGSQSMVISSDLVFKNNIVLRDDAVLTIRNATFSHLSDFSGQYTLQAFDRSRVVIENATIKSSLWISWRFTQDASLIMTNVVNDQSQIWSGFQDRARAVATGVSRFWGTAADSVSFQVDGAGESFVETVFPPGSTVNEAYPRTIGAAGYSFPNAGDAGALTRIELRNVNSTQWGITYTPGSAVTIADTNPLTVTFRIDAIFNGVSAEFSNLRAQLYADATWTTGGATLRLVNTTTNLWSPGVFGNNSLTIRDSDLADIALGGGNSTVTIVNSTVTFLRSNNTQRFTVTGSTIAGDVVATGNSSITLNNTRVLGQIVRTENGQIFINP